MTGNVQLHILLSHMKQGKQYSLHQLYNIYSHAMDREPLILEHKVAYKTLRNNIAMWASIKEGPLQRVHVFGAVYYKLREPKCPYAIIKQWFYKLIGKSEVKDGA